ncbi:MAG TPA: hypothetical protein VMU51_04905 [Mycobacteriales bacterium]|nr:hypothetical protein [Mycobacteriales bacterium]
MTASVSTGAFPGRPGVAARRVLGSAATTPGRLQLMLTGLLGLTLLVGLLGAVAAGSARSGTRQLARVTEPLLVNAETINTALADADATAAQAFLAGGLPPAAQTARYRADIDRAGSQLAAATARVGDSGPAADAVRTLATQLPVYTGLIEAARANNRQGFPVGAAYLAQASQLNRSQLLPAAQRLLTLQQGNVLDGYASARADGSGRWAVAMLVVLLAALVLVQWRLYRRTNRVLNPPLVAATALTVVLAAVLAGVFASQHGRLDRARAEGSDPVGVLAGAHILALQERADEALTLVGRGSGAAYETDFQAVQRVLDEQLLPAAVAQAAGPEQRRLVTEAQAANVAYVAVHKQIRAQDEQGRYNDAVRLATSDDKAAAPAAFARLDRALTAAIAADQSRFDQLAAQAGGGLGLLAWFAPLLAAAIGGLALFGLRARLQEYR